MSTESRMDVVRDGEDYLPPMPRAETGDRQMMNVRVVIAWPCMPIYGLDLGGSISEERRVT